MFSNKFTLSRNVHPFPSTFSQVGETPSPTKSQSYTKTQTVLQHEIREYVRNANWWAWKELAALITERD